ncbi:MAG: TatD family hydrolase [Pseudohongiellaceae bacterium]|jgi:TatD DNase family protein
MQLIDIGANLTHESFQHDYPAVLEAARAAQVAHIILTGTDLASSEAAAQLATTDPTMLSSTVGFHPHIADSVTSADFEQAAQLAARDRVVAVGETGLDFNRNFSSGKAQLSVFEQHLELAVALHKPLFLHQRDAHEQFLPLLRRYRDRLVGGVVHCFTDSERALRDYLDLDMYIGITGWVCDERRGQELQQIVHLIPDQRLLIETDAPYLMPRTLRPKPKSRRNEPRYLPAVLDTLASCRQQPQASLAALTTANARRLFGLPGAQHLDHDNPTSG